jgi:hypothetical protein
MDLMRRSLHGKNHLKKESDDMDMHHFNKAFEVVEKEPS